MFIAIPTGMNYQTERLPVVTFTLIGLNTLIWIVTAAIGAHTEGESNIWVFQNLWLVPALSHPWAYLTSMFVHAGPMHLIGNMIFLFLFGSCVEDLIGRGRYIAFYLVGGFVAELAYIAMSPEHFSSETPLGGASGAISACMGMYLLLRANADIEFKYFLWLFVIRAGEFEIPAWVAITFWFLKDLFFAVLDMTLPHHRGGGVAFGAHVGGLLAGLALIGAWKGLRRAREPEPELVFNPAKAISVRMTHPPAVTTATETPTIYLHDGQAQSGPFTLTQVQEMLRFGSISPGVLYWSEGLADWQDVKDLSANPME
jgi:membrane associated rhomboid family serine protease